MEKYWSGIWDLFHGDRLDIAGKSSLFSPVVCAIMGGQESIRDFIAFPKNNSGRDVMIDSPSNIDEEQLKELNIKLQK